MTDEPRVSIVCCLAEPERRRREQQVRAIFRSVEEAQELPDGYQLKFPGTDEWAKELVDFVVFERDCC